MPAEDRARLTALWEAFDGGESGALETLAALADQGQDAALADFVYRLRQAGPGGHLSWGPNRAFVRPMLAAALLATASAAMADILVVRSTGPSAKGFPPGKRLPESARITLRPGDQLVVLDGRGTRVIRGPGTIAAGAPSAARVASAAPTVQRRARIGAVRGVESGALRPPSIWHVDVARSANICVADPSKLTLWRADSTAAFALDIGGPAAGRSG